MSLSLGSVTKQLRSPEKVAGAVLLALKWYSTRRILWEEGRLS